MPDRTPTIRTIAVRALRVPMEHPHQTAGGTVAESPLVLTDITTDFTNTADVTADPQSPPWAT